MAAAAAAARLPRRCRCRCCKRRRRRAEVGGGSGSGSGGARRWAVNCGGHPPTTPPARPPAGRLCGPMLCRQGWAGGAQAAPQTMVLSRQALCRLLGWRGSACAGRQHSAAGNGGLQRRWASKDRRAAAAVHCRCAWGRPTPPTPTPDRSQLAARRTGRQAAPGGRPTLAPLPGCGGGPPAHPQGLAATSAARWNAGGACGDRRRLPRRSTAACRRSSAAARRHHAHPSPHTPPHTPS